MLLSWQSLIALLLVLSALLQCDLSVIYPNTGPDDHGRKESQQEVRWNREEFFIPSSIHYDQRECGGTTPLAMQGFVVTLLSTPTLLWMTAIPSV